MLLFLLFFFFLLYFFVFFNDTATTEIYTLSLHDALPISIAWRICYGAVSNAILEWRLKEAQKK